MVISDAMFGNTRIIVHDDCIVSAEEAEKIHAEINRILTRIYHRQLFIREAENGKKGNSNDKDFSPSD